jgi:hypothetical protein
MDKETFGNKTKQLALSLYLLTNCSKDKFYENRKLTTNDGQSQS